MLKQPVKSEPAPLIQPSVKPGLIISNPRNLNIVPQHPLTKREREVLYFMAEGLTTKAIAKELQIAFKTAGCHRVSILAKLGVRCTVSAVRWAIREGLIEP